MFQGNNDKKKKIRENYEFKNVMENYEEISLSRKDISI